MNVDVVFLFVFERVFIFNVYHQHFLTSI